MSSDKIPGDDSDVCKIRKTPFLTQDIEEQLKEIESHMHKLTNQQILNLN